MSGKHEQPAAGRPALFLDRDGVINVDKGYVYRSEDVEFVAGIFDLVRRAQALGYLVIIVTNQSGIGRGYYSEEQFHQLSDWMREQFSRRGGHIDAVYFCPYHPEQGLGRYKRDSQCRKPAPGMLHQADADWGIDFSRSVLVGDSATDMAAARAAGVGRVFYLHGPDNYDQAQSVHSLDQVTACLES